MPIVLCLVLDCLPRAGKERRVFLWCWGGRLWVLCGCGVARLVSDQAGVWAANGRAGEKGAEWNMACTEMLRAGQPQRHGRGGNWSSKFAGYLFGRVCRKMRPAHVDPGWSPFRAAEKKYKARCPPPDLSTVLDLASTGPTPHQPTRISSDVFVLPDVPGEARNCQQPVVLNIS